MSTLAEELPYAAVVVNDLLALVCSKCFSTNDDKPLSRCSRCKVAHYCGSQCQKDDWIDHKFECTFLQRVAPRVPSSVPRLIARIALKEKRADTPPAFNGRLFSDLMDHRDSLQKDPQRTEFFACIAHVLYEYMGAEQVPSAKQLMSYFGKICINCFEIQDDNFRALGEGVYVGLSAHDHSCRPAAFVHFEGAKAVLRTPDRAVKYTKQVTISYSSAMQLQSVRRRELREQYYFTCQCALCEDERQTPAHRSFWQDAVARSTVCSFCPEGVCPVDASVERLVCYSCGRPSGMEMMQAIRTNQELEWTLERMKDEKPQGRLTAMQATVARSLPPLRGRLPSLTPLEPGPSTSYGYSNPTYEHDIHEPSTSTSHAKSEPSSTTTIDVKPYKNGAVDGGEEEEGTAGATLHPDAAAEHGAYFVPYEDPTLPGPSSSHSHHSHYMQLEDHQWALVQDDEHLHHSVIGFGNASIPSYGTLARIIPKRRLTVCCVTWNINDKGSKILATICDFLRGDGKAHDVISIALQEIPPAARMFHEEALALMQAELRSHTAYISYRAWSQMLIVFVRHQHIEYAVDRPSIMFVPSAPIPKPLRTKGSIGVCFRLYQRMFVIVASHFSHATINQRLADYQKMLRCLRFPVLENYTGKDALMFAADVILWQGDLNFRVATIEGRVPPGCESLDRLEQNVAENSLEFDELKRSMQKGVVFTSFKEMPIRFAPTHKFQLNKNLYNTARIPSWTDRVLYWQRREGLVEEMLYDSIRSVTASDHRPVYATFTVNVINNPIPIEYLGKELT